MAKIRTRYAPSPTGRMHVGNLRTALYEYLIAKHEGGDFILRIEDTDQERFVEGATEIIYRTIAKCGMEYDEGPDKDKGFGPYVQSERMKTGVYMEYAKKLVEMGEDYYYMLADETLTIDQAMNFFENNRKLVVILVTKNGKDSGRPLKIISTADIVDMKKILDIY